MQILLDILIAIILFSFITSITVICGILAIGYGTILTIKRIFTWKDNR